MSKLQLHRRQPRPTADPESLSCGATYGFRKMPRSTVALPSEQLSGNHQLSENPIFTPSLWIETGTGIPEPGWSTLDTIV